MSFTVWQQKPPFNEESLTPGEKIIPFGDVFVVTDKLDFTQADVDAVRFPVPPPPDPIDDLRTALKADPAIVDRVKALK